MNQQPNNKVLIILIGILLIANLVMLSIFFINKNKETPPEKKDRKKQISSYLKKDIGFNEHQLSVYDSMSNKHLAEVKLDMNSLYEQRKNVVKELALQSFNDSAISKAAAQLSGQQNQIEIKILQHIREIRNICTPAQLSRFDTSFYKVIWKRGDRLKENKK